MPGVTVCVYNKKLKMFRVILPRGKILQSGGFGVAIRRDDSGIELDPDKTTNEYTTSSHLFIEEVIYLVEKGLLQALKEVEGEGFQSWELMEILEELEVPLAAYLAYAYLRSQTYIVLRHREIAKGNCSASLIDSKNEKIEKIELRKSAIVS